MMRRLSGLLAAALLCGIGPAAFAAAPGKINIQGVLRADLGGLEDGNFNFQIQLFADAAATTPFLDETYGATPVNSGVFSLDIGGMTPTLAQGLATATAPQIVISVNGTAMPKQPLSSVAYALHASTAVSAQTVPFSGITAFPASCVANQLLLGFNTGGVANCVADASILTITGGGGITATASGRGVTLGTDATIQKRSVAPACASGFIKSIAADGTATCAPDANSGGTVTSVTAGAGLNGGTITTSGTIDVNFAGTGAAAAVAHSDHTHGFTLSCIKRVSAGQFDATHDQVACNAGETLTGGGCVINAGALIENAQFICPPGLFCFCINGQFCRGAGNWICSSTGSTSITASAECCRGTVN